MLLKLGKDQIHTSNRMLKHPKLGKLVSYVLGYTNIGNYARFSIFKKLLNKLPPIDSFEKILDLGCGFGEYAIGLAKYSPTTEVHALDIDSYRTNRVSQVIKKVGLQNVVLHNTYLENITDDNFNLIYSVDVFEHIAPILMPFDTCWKKLKPGGFLIVKIPSSHQRTLLPEQWFEEHQNWLSKEHIGQVYELNGLSKRFEESGFRVLHASYSDGYLSRLGWEIAYLGKKGGVVTQLLSIPISKLLIRLDRLFHSSKWGNTIQVIGQKE